MSLKQGGSHLLVLIWVVLTTWILSVDGGTEKEILEALDEAAAEGSWGYVPLSGPYIDVIHSGNVTAQVGATAILHCRILYIVGKPVSWIRSRDLHLLTVGRFTYTSDDRFKAIHQSGSQDWLLKIHYLQERDAGPYECQVSTTPPMSHTVWLTVVEPQTIVLGGPDLYINAGSAINLTCLVKHSPQPPPYIFWYHNEELLSYEKERGEIQVLTGQGVDATSQLIIQKAKRPDSGQYTCLPATAPPFSLIVHVISSEESAAIYHKNMTSKSAESGGGRLSPKVPLQEILILGALPFLIVSGDLQQIAGTLHDCWRDVLDVWWIYWWWWTRFIDGVGWTFLH